MKLAEPLSLFRELLKTKATKKGRLLGLDVGDKYVGLAVSDPLNKIASPVSVLLRKQTNIEAMASDLQSLFVKPWLVVVKPFAEQIMRACINHVKIAELSLEGFVVGYPFDRKRNAPNAIQVKVFVDDLYKTGKLEGLKYTYWDESFTSKNVELLIKPLDLHPVEAKCIMDKFAAVGILQGYLDYVNKKVKSESSE